MNSCDEDLFAITDEEVSSSSSQFVRLSNPVEKYLMKQFINVQNKIETTTNDIEEVKATAGYILNVLQQHVQYGTDINSDIDNDLYTIEGEPVIKKKQDYKTNNIERNLEITSQWQCVLHDKWIIGVELRNGRHCALNKLRYYPWVKNELEIRGESMLWQLWEDRFWRKIDSIHGGTAVVATTAIDLPVFARESVIHCWGMISYEIGETRFQMSVPIVRLSAAEIINCSWIKFLDESKHVAILALKSTSSTEKIVNIQLWSDPINNRDEHDTGKKRFFRFLAEKTFEKIHDDIFLVKIRQPALYNIASFTRRISEHDGRGGD
ncbi:uncharacterized protein LOC105188442 isoform X2 [Harpegnathos saltator]|uniref:uncharacterized protein LOC105188442 isoform X2 n=1 Tax=Harpegnathos saltator TaxID=610380 RepID=UPI00058D5AA9|nr:uncharacterized protein LOC105188442 isoform X2 [Harpegnathos saltator]